MSAEAPKAAVEDLIARWSVEKHWRLSTATTPTK